MVLTMTVPGMLCNNVGMAAKDGSVDKGTDLFDGCDQQFPG